MHLRKKKKYKRMYLYKIDLVEKLQEPGQEEFRIEMERLIEKSNEKR